MSGSQWAPYGDVNPAKTWDYSTGTVGLAYETTFRFNPLNGEFIPWLATGGNWRTKNVVRHEHPTRCEVQRRQDADADGCEVQLRPAEDADASAERAVGLDGAAERQGGREHRGVHVRGQARLPAVRLLPVQRRDRPAARLRQYSTTDLTTGNLDADKVVGTGPYAYQSGASSTSQTFVWQRRNDWWATKALGLRPAPRYVVDIHNTSNTAAFANFQAGNIDLFNNFAPRSAIRGKFKTFYNKAPYHLGANTTWLFPNTTKKPLNDPQFRRALAYSINMNQILDKAYQGLVDKASPTGLLPIWSKWVDKKVVAKYGFSYSLARAKSTLAAAGYKDSDGDGYVENKDGSDISLTIRCPNGWSDWMIAIQVVAESAKAAGIKITPGYPDYGTLVDDRGHARYDLVLANDRQYSNTPWTYYQYIFQLPILDNQTTVNYERFPSTKAWNLTQLLDKTPTSNAKAYQAVMSKLQTVFLQNLPAIPLWYNGMWAMFNTTHWTNWPSATGNRATPTAWNNYWQMTSIDMLTNLKPAKK